VPGHVQVELPFGDLARVEIGGKDLLTRIIRPRQHATERTRKPPRRPSDLPLPQDLAVFALLDGAIRGSLLA
jgi:hypothetical protein